MKLPLPHNEQEICNTENGCQAALILRVVKIVRIEPFDMKPLSLSGTGSGKVAGFV
jgi:hypothetical protein